MNPARVLFAGAAVAAAAASGAAPRSSGANVGEFADGKGNPSRLARIDHFKGGLFQKYLSNFPQQHRVKAGATTLVGAGVLLFFLAKPRTNAGSPDTQCRTPEWDAAEAKFLDKQRISPAHK